MANLKPRLIMTQTGRKRRGFGKLLLVLIIFAAGFYTGSKYGDSFFETIATQNGHNISDIEASDRALEQKSVEQESKQQVSTEMYGNPENQDIESQTFLAESVLEAQGETSSPYLIQNDNLAGHDSTENALISGDESGSFLQVGTTLDISAPSDNQDEPLKSRGVYTLQVAAFSTPEEANSAAEGYIAKGYEAYVVPIENSRGESWNLVKIGRFNTIEKAFSYATYFKNREGIEAYVENLEQETVFNESWRNSEQAERE